MSLSHEHVGPKILGKIKIYVLVRAELLFPLCYEIPCSSGHTVTKRISICVFQFFSSSEKNKQKVTGIQAIQLNEITDI